MKIKEVLALPTNELALILQGLVDESEYLKVATESAVDKRRERRARIEKKVFKITMELKQRGWEAIVYGHYVKFEPLGNSKKQDSLI